MSNLERIVVWYSIDNCGDGSAYPIWFLTKQEAQTHQEKMSEGWGESCIGSVETYFGSDIHHKAINNVNFEYDS